MSNVSTGEVSSGSPDTAPSPPLLPTTLPPGAAGNGSPLVTAGAAPGLAFRAPNGAPGLISAELTAIVATASVARTTGAMAAGTAPAAALAVGLMTVAPTVLAALTSTARATG